MKLEQYASAFQQGDEKALAFIYQEFYPALALYAYRWIRNRSIAEELGSQAILKAWKKNYKLHSYNAIRAYLYKIVHRDCINTFRKEQKRTVLHKEACMPDITSETPYDQVVRSEFYRLIHKALKDLPPGSRKVLMMHYFDGKSTGEIARELNKSASTIKTQKLRGLEALRKVLPRTFIVFYKFLDMLQAKMLRMSSL